MSAVRLKFITQEAPNRSGEPICVGLPWPRGALREENRFHFSGDSPLQTRVLDRWSDGSIRWCLFDFFAHIGEGKADQEILIGESHNTISPSIPDWHPEAFDLLQKGLKLEFTSGPALLKPLQFQLVDSGPVRYRWRFDTATPLGIELFGFLDLYAGLKSMRVQLTIRNTHASGHPGGTWDLGNTGSVYIKQFSLNINHNQSNTILISPERSQPFIVAQKHIHLHQESSGGGNWKSINHINNKREIPLRYNGYQLQRDSDDLLTGKRATPIVITESPASYIGLAVPYFWENFPKAIHADSSSLRLDFFPSDLVEPIELQGGEQKTHTFHCSFASDSITPEPLVWMRSPTVCHAEPEWYEKSEALCHLVPKAIDNNSEYLALVNQAIEGDDTFFIKREKMDEFGWRNIGDVPADHEGVKHTGQHVFISHYNNQYDCVAGFAAQFFRDNNPRWHQLMMECADHTADIDIYHTQHDKAAYNGGMFWHTYHYAEADTSTHRSYPMQLQRGPVDSLSANMDQLGETGKKLQAAYAVGGGPSASHCYATGLMLSYFMTGNPNYHESVLNLADQIIAMENPNGTPFRILSQRETGQASDSQANYHGPGRASGNAVSALLDGHRMSGNESYLKKAEQLIERVTSPRQNLDDLDLLNAETRWFYTVHLQALGKYLDHKIELNQLDRMYAYAQQTLLHYARWMVKHERPILDSPEKLQYPTESWPAQEMRKVEVLQYAAKHTSGDERQRFLDKADWFFQYVVRTLNDFPTKALARPVVLLLSFGWSRAYWQNRDVPQAPAPRETLDISSLAPWSMFVPQKVIAMKRAKKILAAGVVVAVLGICGLVAWLVI